MYVFDLDGTLADTKEAWLQAYEAAGVRRVVAQAHWHDDWASWTTKEVYEAKNLAYLELLPNCVGYGPAKDRWLLAPEGERFVLTATPAAAVNIIRKELSLFREPVLPVLEAKLSRAQRADWLRKLSRIGELQGHREFLYFDDNAAQAAEVVKGTLFEAVVV
jgi:hypothetical protein